MRKKLLLADLEEMVGVDMVVDMVVEVEEEAVEIWTFWPL